MRRELKSRASVTLALGVKTARDSLQLTKMVLADRAGCSPQHVTNVESRLCNPSQALISELADALGQTPAELYQLGEVQLELKTVEIVRERRRRVRAERDLEAMLEVLCELDEEEVAKLANAAREVLDR